MSRSSSSVPIRVPLLVVLGVACLALAPALLLGRIPAETQLAGHYGPWWSSGQPVETITGGDSFFVYLPDRLAAVREWRAGRLPLWNPYLGGGMPMLGMQTANPLDPLIVFQVAGVPLGRALGASYAVWLFLAGLGMVLLLRAQGVRHPAALAAAGVAFALNPYFLRWLELRVFLGGLATLPLMLWALDDLLRGSRRRRSAGVLALCLGGAAAAGTLQTLALCLGVLGLRALWHLAFRHPDRRVSLAGLTPAVGAVCLGLALGSLTLYAGLELLGQSVRVEATRDYYAGANFLSWRALGMWWNPDLFGPLEGPESPHWDLFRRTAISGSGWGALGVIPLGLAVLALVRRTGPASERYFWGGIAGLLLVGLLLMASPVGDLIVAIWPGLNGVDLLRLLILVNLAGAVLAGWGVEEWLRAWSSGRLRGWLVPWCGFVLTGVLILVAAGWGVSDAGSVIRHAIPLVVVALLILGIGLARIPGGPSTSWKAWALVALIALELGRMHAAVNSFAPPKSAYPRRNVLDPIRTTLGPPDYPRFLVYSHMRIFPPNVASVFELSDVRSYTNVPITRFRSFLEWAEEQTMANQEYLSRVDSPIYRLLGVRYLFSTPGNAGKHYEPAPLPRFPVGYFRRTDALPRAFLVHAVRRVPDRDALRRELQDPGFDPLRAVLLVGGAGDDVPAAPPSGEEHVEFSRREPARMTVEVRATAPGILVVSDVYYPGWWARVNGRRATILPAYGGLRGISVPAGTSRVEFGYRPWWLVPGLAVSLAALVLSAWLCFDWRGRRSVDRE